MATPSGVVQMLTSTTNKRRLNREARAALLRVRTGPECPEDNLRELMRDSNPNCGIARERGKKKEKENFHVKSSNLRHCRPTHRTKDSANTRGELASCGLAHSLLEAGMQAGNSQSWKVRGKLSPRDGIPYQTVSRLPVANQVFLGSWTVDICWEGRSQRSAPQRRHTAHLRQRSLCAPRKLSSWDWGGDKTHHSTWGECAHQAPGHRSCSDLGRAQNAGPTESAPLWSTREPEPEKLRPGKRTQPRACLRQFPCRATWSLSSADQDSRHVVSGHKPSVAQTLRALPTHASDICLQCSSLPTAQLNK